MFVFVASTREKEETMDILGINNVLEL